MRRRPLENGTLMPVFLEGNMVSRVGRLERTQRELDRLGLSAGAAASAYGRRVMLDGWFGANLTGTQGAGKLDRFGGLGAWQRDALMMRGGRVLGLGVAVNGARVGGSASFELYVNDVASGLAAVLDAGATVFAWEAGEVAFEGGDGLSVYLTTVGWSPTTADAQVMMEVALD